MTHKELLRQLEANGWVLRRAKTGTHMSFRKEGVREILTLRDRAGHEKVPKGYWPKIERIAGVVVKR
jgi:predicted RNA binding protein YcfA (HicA-like mRNA interferase family)